MNRRGHLSHKVPNVKLRPVGPRRSTRRHPSPSDADVFDAAWGEAESMEDDKPMRMGGGDKPWSRMVLTFTGVENKAELTSHVRELGATVESALTVHSTHVIASGFASAKYLYAVEHRIPVLSPSWIVESYNKWIEGNELDVPDSIEDHRLQPFLGLKIAVSGIEELDRRKQIIKYINHNGGLYSKDLDRTCTHLISAHPTSDPKSKKSEKVKWALRQIGDNDIARRRGRRVEGDDMQIVYEEWIWDCVAYRGRWKEEAYSARKARGRGRVRYEDVLDGSAFLSPVMDDTRNRTDGGEDEEDQDGPVAVRKRKRGGVPALVGELLGVTMKKEGSSEIKVEETHLNINLDEVLDGDTKPDIEVAAEELPSRGGAFERQPSLLHASRSTAFTGPPVAGPSRLSAPSTGAVVGSSNSPRASSPLPQIFTGLRISHAIAEGYHGLENALSQHGAVVVSEEDRLSGEELVDYVIVRLGTAKPDIPVPAEGENVPTLVTECWVEGCCFEQRLLPPDDKLVFRPLTIDTPIADVEKLLVHISGFPTEIGVYLRRLLRAIGGTVSEKLNRRTTHLVCAAPAGQKYDKATEWGVKIVRDSWLWTMGQTGSIDPVEEHAHNMADVGTTAAAPAAAITANMSVMSEVASLPAQQSVSSLPATRVLKSTPTHIDRDGDLGGGGADANPLSPPKVATERLLNRARVSPASASAPESSPRRAPSAERERLSKAVTAPTALASGSSSGGGAGGDDNLTAALRRLAEIGETAPARPRVLRRARPGASSTRFARADTASSVPSVSTSPVKEKDTAGADAGDEDPRSPLPGAAGAAGGFEDESMRITYADPVGEKEKRRLLAAVMRSSASPIKRRRM